MKNIIKDIPNWIMAFTSIGSLLVAIYTYDLLKIDNKNKSKTSTVTPIQTPKIILGNKLLKMDKKEVNYEIETVKNITHDKSKKSIDVFNKNNLISIVPEARIWFGIINIDTGKREHFSISDKYQFDTSKKSWIATSSANFTIIFNNVNKKFNDGNNHYFRIDKDGLTTLTRRDYILEGGYKYW